MAIIDLKTDLRSIRYSTLGTIGEPIVTKKIPGGEREVDTNAGKGSLSSLDIQAEARRNDLKRFRTLLGLVGASNTTPQTTRFTSNLALINQQATLAKIQKKDFEGLGREALGGLADTGKVIASTIAQVPVAGTGIHFVNGGKVGKEYLPGGGNSIGSFLRAVIGAGGGVQGHELILGGNTIVNDSVPSPTAEDPFKFTDNTLADVIDNKKPGSLFKTDKDNKVKSDLSKENKQSTFVTKDGPTGNETTIAPGQGSGTEIKYTDPEEPNAETNLLVSKDATGPKPVPAGTGITGQSVLAPKVTSLEKSDVAKRDTTGKFDRSFGSGHRKGTGRTNKAIWVRSTGDQSKYVSSDPDTGVSAIDIYNQQGILDALPEEVKEDIIPFEFQIFDPATPENQKYLYFRAFLTDFSDNFSGDWSGTKYIGRAEEVYNYNGFKRDISFNFNLAAFTKEELIPIYQKLNYFAGTTSPSYSSDQSFMRGVYAKLTVGDYLQKVPGFFTSISLSWNTAYPWEVGYDENINENDLPRNPTILDVSATYQPVHNFNPAIGESFIGSSRQVVNA